MVDPLPGDRAPVARALGRVRAVPGLPAGGATRHLHDEPDRVDQRPATQGHPQPRPVPLRTSRVEGALPRRAQPRRVPQSERRDEKLGLETSAPSVHDLLRGTHPHTMTTTIIYTDGLTRPQPRTVMPGCPWSVLRVRWVVYRGS